MLSPLLALYRGDVAHIAEAIAADFHVVLETTTYPLALGAVFARMWELASSIAGVSVEASLVGLGVAEFEAQAHI